MTLPIALRPATTADLAFGYAVTESAMRGYVEQTWGVWNPAQQHALNLRTFAPDTHQIVWLDDRPVGLLAVELHARHVQVEKLYLLPHARDQGVGSQVLEGVLRSAFASGKPVKLRVLAVNRAAQRFYRRHGFEVTATTPERLFMQASPPGPSAPEWPTP